MKHKIAIVCGHLSPGMGYIENVLPKYIKKAEFEVKVFTSDVISEHVVEFIHGQEPQCNFPVERFKSILNRRQVVIINPFQLLMKLKKFSPSIIIIVSPTKILPFFAIFYKRAEKIILIGETSIYKVYRGVKGFFKKSILRASIKNASYTLFTTPIAEYEKFLGKIFPDNKAYQIFLPFDPELFYYSENERKRLRETLNVGNEEKLIITVGKATPQKKLEWLIRFVAEYRDLPIKLLIIGMKEDAYSIRLQSLVQQNHIQNKVILYNFLNRNELRPFFNAADLGVWTQPSVAIQEAMGTGLPVIVRGVYHILKDGRNGILVKGRDYKAFADALERGLDKNWDRKRLFKFNKYLSAETLVNKIMNEIIG